MNRYPVRQLYDKGLLTDIDIQFADLMARLSGESGGEDLYLACVLLNNTVGRGKHVCLDFDAWADRSLFSLLDDGNQVGGKPVDDFITPAADEWMSRLARSPVVGSPGDYTPLVLDQTGRRLHMFRYWQYEQQLAAGFRERLNHKPAEIDFGRLKNGLKRCFTSSGHSLPVNWQKVAAFAALTRNICVITGGPGTGKTFTAARIIGLILAQQPDAAIALCAPTGKAAARLQASMAAARERMTTEMSIPVRMFPETVYTIHRLLGASNMDAGFRYNENRHLPVNVVIIDEASMVSLSLMAGLFAAIDRKTRLILLGDKNQLSSVEAGAVLGDICAAGSIDRFSDDFFEQYLAVCDERLPQYPTGAGNRLSDSIVELKHNYRFSESSAMNAVSRSINQGDAVQTCRIIDADTSGTVIKEPLPGTADLAKRLERIVLPYFNQICRAESIDTALAALDAFRIICAHRKGVYGVAAVNRLVEKVLAARGLINAADAFYKGRPVLVTHNDYNRKLYNGDVGLIWEDAAGHRRACFPDPGGGYRTFSPFRLPAHETVFAMTIHKSQGSEFDSLLMILPENPSPVLTRELVYTGLTRARKSIRIWTGDDILASAVRAHISRRSGLQDALKHLAVADEKPKTKHNRDGE